MPQVHRGIAYGGPWSGHTRVREMRRQSLIQKAKGWEKQRGKGKVGGGVFCIPSQKLDPFLICSRGAGGGVAFPHRSWIHSSFALSVYNSNPGCLLSPSTLKPSGCISSQKLDLCLVCSLLLQPKPVIGMCSVLLLASCSIHSCRKRI